MTCNTVHPHIYYLDSREQLGNCTPKLSKAVGVCCFVLFAVTVDDSFIRLFSSVHASQITLSDSRTIIVHHATRISCSVSRISHQASLITNRA